MFGETNRWGKLPLTIYGKGYQSLLTIEEMHMQHGSCVARKIESAAAGGAFGPEGSQLLHIEDHSRIAYTSP